MITRHSIQHRGFTLSFLDTDPQPQATGPTKPVVLLLHGFPDTAEMWTEQMALLCAQGYRCIAPDTLGCGESAMAPRTADYKATAIAADHVALLDSLEVDQAHVVGHDWGAAIAWFMAAYYPQRCCSLAVLAVGHPTAYGRSGWAQKRRGWYTLFFQIAGLAEYLLRGEGRLSLRRVFASHPQMDAVMERLRQPGRMTAALRIYRAAVVPVLLQSQPRVSTPTLGIWSADDRFLVESQMLESERWVDANWDYVRLEGGHWVPLDQPQHLNNLLLNHF